MFHTLGHGTTLAAWIRHQRLERIRHDLADPTQRALPIHLIAARWGYTDPALFSRATYGTTPRDYRHHTPNDSTAGHQPGPIEAPDDQTAR
ncbi:helix-turn-helix domain-containing protein [Streptomyces sp. 8K308]|uniref:helix-turn-helix domain-containing protein n=1 Tax=Streptomyces sp. 8K308 TaxID=2530388 RepID=UPI001FB5AB02|nr:helix-turn-helix domain-containing protein [Streptomyces sp. 8K308]